MHSKNIVLVGFMATGKSETGRLLARKLGRRYYDSDTLVENREGMEIAEIFAQKGEDYFRQKEAEIIAELAEMQAGTAVISAGGGVVLQEKNLCRLRRNGVIIALTASPEVIMQRVKGDAVRPLLQVESPRERIEELLAERKPYYNQADFSVDTDRSSPAQVAEAILCALDNRGRS